MTKCSDVSCVGGKCSEDDSKIICGIQQLKQNGCVIYSIGGNNEWQFELELLQKTPCDIHTFDCTGPISRFQVPPNPRLHFHHVCLGTQFQPKKTNCPRINMACGEMWTLHDMQRRLKHDRIDLLKMDIEGWEWPLIESWPDSYSSPQEAEQVILPMQILVEASARNDDLFFQSYGPSLKTCNPSLTYAHHYAPSSLVA